ncbi:uncharacterized protein LOC126830141 [Patella vulgata]|uniref:uncharacterized protein LOC126830141 n=1 Tax=Patella vulgata TaxID=6465 RepID=UPI0024A8960C|nr:uncharacterized protein LOC126830141 [Patella vulgata]
MIPPSVVSTSKFLYVTFHTDHSQTRTGFNATYGQIELTPTPSALTIAAGAAEAVGAVIAVLIIITGVVVLVRKLRTRENGEGESPTYAGLVMGTRAATGADDPTYQSAQHFIASQPSSSEHDDNIPSYCTVIPSGGTAFYENPSPVGNSQSLANREEARAATDDNTVSRESPTYAGLVMGTRAATGADDPTYQSAQHFIASQPSSSGHDDNIPSYCTVIPSGGTAFYENPSPVGNSQSLANREEARAATDDNTVSRESPTYAGLVMGTRAATGADDPTYQSAQHFIASQPSSSGHDDNIPSYCTVIPSGGTAFYENPSPVGNSQSLANREEARAATDDNTVSRESPTYAGLVMGTRAATSADDPTYQSAQHFIASQPSSSEHDDNIPSYCTVIPSGGTAFYENPSPVGNSQSLANREEARAATDDNTVSNIENM